ncbi:MAG: DUF1330 domain-containing protein [Candidatus Dechloromonas phosphoritropha]|jgi:uncharacterized protein (DUF1330 family)|nr:DUF1330 domain-containing protein [Candidatus Dechloromonas phosphoritropha]MBP8787767.1 DUF1330 domain-containing protein [Azonexus sp.]MBP9226646.1 DUF1330 domain-containing protein [Azonexus sp.]
MSACIIGHITIRDVDKWAEYRARVPATLAPWGAELLFRGQLAAVLSGEYAASDTVVIRFPDGAAVAGWYQSAAYQALIPLREQAADFVLLSFTD